MTKSRARTRKGANGLPFDFKHLFRMQATAEDVQVSSPRVFVRSRRIRTGMVSSDAPNIAAPMLAGGVGVPARLPGG